MTDDFNPNFTSSSADVQVYGEIASAGVMDEWEQACHKLRKRLRPGQDRMADWEGGPLAVSAVPGAGKSTGMATAAALTIARYQLHSRRQLVVVTFTRSAAANIKGKIRENLRELSLPPIGFVVYTLHGLALNIASRHPDLSELNLENSTLITPNQSHRLIRACVEQWIVNQPRRYQRLMEGMQFDGEETERLRRQSVLRTEVLPQLASTVIHEAKSSGLLPEHLREMCDRVSGDEYEILAIAADLFQNYQNLLRSRNLLDYDEMILGAQRVLDNPQAKSTWQNQVFAVFEDEAQDSAPLQTKLLETLATDPANPDNPPNLIRVGDPNQAINSTFTPADPIYFRQFCKNCQFQGKLAEMDRAGRSTQIIMDAANFALEWVNSNWGLGKPTAMLVEPPFRFQEIKPVPLTKPDADVNPVPEGRGLEIYQPIDIYRSVELIAERIKQLFTPLKPGKEWERSAAVLVRENKQGKFVAELLKNPQKYGLSVDLNELGIKVFDVGDEDRNSQVPLEILVLLQFIDRPHSPDYLKAALKVLSQRGLIPKQDYNALTAQPEEFLYPGPLDPPQSEPIRKCRIFCCSLLSARLELPLYQLIAFLAFSLQYNQTGLATADKLAERLTKEIYGNNSLSAMIEVLSEIVSSERFEPVDADAEVEERYRKKGQLTIITMHKAKGLDWDYVFLPFLHQHTIPGNLRVLPQSRFLGNFTLAEVARAQIRASLHGKYPLPEVGEAWEQAELLKTAEEFRLLYVAMTRAKRLLWMAAERKGPFTWNKPENLQEQKPCPVVPALKQRFPKHYIH